MTTVAFDIPLHQSEYLSEQQKRQYKDQIKALLKKEDAVLVAHYYTDDVIQALAEETGGCVSDSLEMARFGTKVDAKTIVVAGVKFMGETAKILSPEKRVLMPTLEATCSLDLGCPIRIFAMNIRIEPLWYMLILLRRLRPVQIGSLPLAWPLRLLNI